MTYLGADGLGEGVGHGAMIEGAEQAPLAVHGEIARRPDRRGAHIAGKHRVLGGNLVEHPDHVLGMNGLLAGLAHGQLIEALPCLPVVLERSPQVLVVPVLLELGQEGSEGRLGVPHEAVVDPGTPAQLFPAEVDLDDGRVRGKELLVREVRSDHQQEVTVHHGVIARGESEQSGHADVERIVVLDELFPAHGVHDGGVQLAREQDQLGMGPRTARSPQDSDLLRRIESLGEGGGKCRRGCCSTASRKAMSPGRAITDTPRRERAVWMAISRIRGICSGWDTSSQWWLHCAKRCSGWVSWKYPLPISWLGICAAMARTGTRLR